MTIPTDTMTIASSGKPYGSRNLFGAHMARETATDEELKVTEVGNEQINKLPLADEYKKTLRSSPFLKSQLQGQLIAFLRKGQAPDEQALHRAAINVLGL